LYLAIDNTIEKMESQIKKLKDRVTDHQKKSVKDMDEFSRASLYHGINANEPKKLIKTKRVITETLSVQEAIEKLSESEDGYYIFKNVETDGINVLVRKDETHFKLFEP
jgi:putative sigma-54 modulation protein